MRLVFPQLPPPKKIRKNEGLKGGDGIKDIINDERKTTREERREGEGEQYTMESKLIRLALSKWISLFFSRMDGIDYIILLLE
jgi:hypothetical protein